MALTADFSIANIKLFSDESDIDSQLPTEALRNLFLTIAQSVATLPNYEDASRFKQLLRLRVGDLSTSEKGTLIAIISNTNDNIGYSTASSATNLFDTSYQPSLLLSSNNAELTNKIKARLATDLATIVFDTLGSGNPGAIEAYRSLMLNVCKEIFEFYYPKLRVAMPELALPEIFSYERYAQIFITHIKTNASKQQDTFFSSSTTDNTYFKEVHTRLMQYTSSADAQIDAVQNNKKVMRIFLSCFFPYFNFEFYLNNIATRQITSLDKAPRYFLIRRIAILAVYMSLFYSMLTIAGESTIPTDLRSIMGTFNDVLFANEIKLMYHNMTYATVHQEATENRELSKNLNYITKDITVSRGNLTKAMHNDVNMNKDFKSSYVIMFIWLSLLGITLIASIVLYIFKIEFMFAFCIIIIGVLGISGIVSLSKKF
jgi:hypothetical protein